MAMEMEISNAYNSYGSSYINTTDSRKKQLEKYSCADESSVAKEAVETDSTTKKTAADELSYLSKKYSNYSFVAANYTKEMRYGTMETTNIAISPQFLKKMADNPELEKEYELYFEGMKKLDEENIRTHEARGRRMVAQGWAIDKNGGISRWGISEPTNKRHYGQEMTDYANKLREQKLKKKREQEKIEERRQSDREEKEELDEAGKGQFGDKWKGVVVIAKDYENAAVTKAADKNNEEATGMNMDIKA